jgi:hypothetical protein
MRRTLDDLAQFVVTVKIQMKMLAKTVAQRRTEETRAGGCADLGREQTRLT